MQKETFRLPPYRPPTFTTFRKRSNARRPFMETLWYHYSKRVLEAVAQGTNIREEHWGRRETCAKCRREKRNMGEFESDLTMRGIWVLIVGPIVMSLVGAIGTLALLGS